MSWLLPKPVVAPYYAAAAVWLLYALLFPLHRPIHFAIVAAASIVMFLIAFLICRSGAQKAAVNAANAAKAQPHAANPKPSGNPELDKMLLDGEKAIAEMKRLDLNIEDPEISADIVHLQQTSEKIFSYVRERPEKLSDIRKFMDYYLPTTLKILNSYDRMSAQGVSGENIDTTLERIQNLMHTVVAAFDKQLDFLFGEEALDISTDITVLENMIACEGLSEEKPLKAEETGEGGVSLHL